MRGFVEARAQLVIAIAAFALLSMASAAAAQGVSFPTTVTYTVGSFPRSLAIADFNGDGKADLAVVNETSQAVSILLGHGDGTFTAGPSFYVPGGGYAIQVAAGDFNGDGKIDLAVTNLLGHNVAVFLGHGDGTFGTATTFGVNGAAFAVATADVNGDGKVDLVVTNAAGGSTGQTLQVLLGNGDGTFAAAVSYPTGADPQWVATGDFNGDGHLDLIAANNGSNTVSLFLGRGDGTFQPPSDFATGVSPQAIAVADFNEDGNLDFAVINSNSNSVSIRLGDGHGGFVAATSLTTGSTPTGIALGDVNGDGAPDLVVANQLGNSLSIFISKGDGTFQPAVTLNLGQSPNPVAVADLNGDGKADVIAGELYVSSVAVALNGTTFPATITAQSGTPQSTPLNTAYATAMTVLVQDAGTQPLTGLVVMFSAPTSGASGVFAGGLRSARAITNASGVATAPVFTANGATGSFSIAARVGTISTNFALTNGVVTSQAPVFTSSPPPNGVFNLAYSFGVTASGMPAPTFSVPANALPPGLGLQSVAGVISGIPSASGTFAGTLTATNGVPPDATQTFAITITATSYDTVWVEDAVPSGATAASDGGDTWNWISSNPTPYSGVVAHQSLLTAGEHQHYFYNATGTLAVATGDTLFAYLYMDPANPPSEVMLQWNDGSWEHRAYWGANLIPWGNGGTVSRHAMGSLPAVGQWVRLEVAASVVGLEGHVLNGMAFTLYDGRATWDRAGKSSTATQASQTITFNALANQTLDNPPVTISAEASSGLAVGFSSLTSAVCAVSGNTVTLVAAGTCTIRASQAGNANYSAAPNVSRSFTVTSVLQSQTITFGALSNQTFGAAPFTVSATASSGLLVNFASLTTLVCTISGSTVTLVSSGTCTIQASQTGNASYAAAPNVNRSFSVTQAAQTLSFAPAVNYATGTYPDGIALGDFNGDGELDLAVANAFSANVSILIGHGDGTFSPGANVPSGGFPARVGVGDFNGDGKLDLAVCDFTGGSVIIFSGNGNGTFTRVGSFSSGLYPEGLAVADVNRDGKLDLVIANGTSGNTTGQTVTVLLGNGDGSFRAPVSYPTGASPYAVVVADFNGDGKPDLAVANFGSNTASILMGNGDGTFAAAVNYATGTGPDELAVGDFNGDGKLDLAVVNDYSDNVSIFLGHGDGTFGAATNFTTGFGSASVAVADFNGDGWADLAVVNRFDNTLVVLLGNGNGTFQAPLTYSVGGQTNSVVARDLNGDGKPDLVVSSAANNNISVLLQTNAVPAMLSVQSGSPQSSFVGTAYPTRFAVLVQDAGGHPLPGVAITFTAPAAGASGTFGGAGTVIQAASNASGIATAPVFTANSIGGSFTVTASYSGSSATFALANTTSTQAPQFTSGPPPNGTYGIPYAFTLIASGVPAPIFAVVGALPAGLTLNPTTGGITGTPSLMGTANGAFSATNGVGTTAVQVFNILIVPRITFGALSNQPLGTPPFALTASASSGLPVTFTSLTPTVCTTSGSTVTLVAAGTCTIRASQAGDATYGAATNVDQSFTVTPILASQITFGALSNQTFGAGPFSVSATASSGLPVTFSSLTLSVCLVNANTATLLAVGTCTIRAAQGGDATHSPAPDVDRSFTVAAESQTIVITGPISSVSLGAPQELYAIASSGLPVSFASLTPAICRIDANLIMGLTSGACTIRATQSGDSNFSAAPDVERGLSITAAFEYLTFWPPGDHFRTDPPVQLSASTPSGLPVTFLSLTPSVCRVDGSIATLLTGGTCTVRASQAGSAEFQPASADQSFFVLTLYSPDPPAPFTGPLVVYSTYLGSSSNDTAFDVVVGSDGNAYVGGSVASTDFPGLSSATFTNGGLDLLHVAKINTNDGSLGWVTAVGGRAADITNSGSFAYVGAAPGGASLISGGGQVEAMARDAAGNIYVATYANSVDFPVRGGTYLRNGAKHIVQITPSGTMQALGAAIDPAVSTIRALAVDSAGSVYFTGVAGTGLTTSPNAAIRSVPAGTTTAPYLIKLAPGGNDTVFATYLSVPGSRPGTRTLQSHFDAATTAYALAVDSAGNTYLAGQATADDFPVTPGAAGDQRWTQDIQFRDAFVAKVNTGGTAFVFVARLGGSDAERATSIALSPDGGIVIGGKSATYPLYGSGAFQTQVIFGAHFNADREIGFIAKLLPDGSDWQFVAPIGASHGSLVDDGAFSDTEPFPVKVAVDAGGAIYASGTTSTNRSLPLTSNLSGVPPTGAFIMKLSADGSRQIYSTALGDFSVATGLALDGFGNAYLAGYGGFISGYGAGPPLLNTRAVPNAESNWGGVFVAKFNDLIAPVTLTTDANPGNAGRSVNLIARLADARFTGTIEFRDTAQVLGTVSLSNGSATLPMTFTAGIHRLSATYHGSGLFDGSAAAEIIQVINQAPAGP